MLEFLVESSFKVPHRFVYPRGKSRKLITGHSPHLSRVIFMNFPYLYSGSLDFDNFDKTLLAQTK